ncbi:MAG: hypothetical protein QF805_23320, partial [Pirellulaceae bacterium]|nr:hypothetical protein [Pirellulaceae bacterium]
MTRFSILFSAALIAVVSATACRDSLAQDKPTWNIEQPPGPRSQQAIDTTEGTWMNLDVSPDGKRIVFDMLGDLYLMPIDGADG